MSNKAFVNAILEEFNVRRFLVLNPHRLVVKCSFDIGKLTRRLNTRKAKEIQKAKGVARCYIKHKRGRVTIKIILSKKFKY